MSTAEATSVVMATATKASMVPVVVPMVPSHVRVVVPLHPVLLLAPVVVVVVAVVVVPAAVAVVHHDDATPAPAVHTCHHAHVHGHHGAHHHAGHHGATATHTLPGRRVSVAVTILRVWVGRDDGRDDSRCRGSWGLSGLRSRLHQRLAVGTEDWTTVGSKNWDHHRRFRNHNNLAIHADLRLTVRSDLRDHFNLWLNWGLRDHHHLAIRTDDGATVWPNLLNHHRGCLWWHGSRHHEWLTIWANNRSTIRSHLRHHLRLRWHHGLLGGLDLLSRGSLAVLLLHERDLSLIFFVLLPHLLGR